MHFATVEVGKSDSGSEDDDVEMELGREIFHILQGSKQSSSLFGSNIHLQGMVDTPVLVKPPSRNQNPLIKDQRFEKDSILYHRDMDADASVSFLVETQCCDGFRSALSFQKSEITVG
mmetsp:Transcript_22043/g.60379  ORF Transcript_22043/g.60379 Transcript_22043/m.60379 type:complete len:118 (-) Transcript_22043:320-673(-)